MADEPLSQAELDTLLRSANSESNGAGGVRSLHRADRSQIRALAFLHQDLAGSLAGALGGLLRAKTAMALRGVDETTFGEFHARLDSPCCLNVLGAAPLEGQWLLDIDRAILYPMLDRMLGGGREPSIVVERPLTQIEQRLTRRITSLFVAELANTWQRVVDLKPAVERLETNAEAARIVAGGEVVLVSRFELAIGQSSGTVSLCVPAASLAPIAGTLTTCTDAVPGRQDAAAGDGAGQLDLVEIVAHLADVKITAAELASLQVGDIIATDQDSQAAVTLRIDGQVKFRGRAGALDGHKAVRIEADGSTP